MECLNCSASNPDGKRFCGDCGALLDTSFGAVKQYLDANLRREIQTTLKEEFRDQKFIEVETTEAIVTKLTSWAKLFAFVVGIPLAGIVVVLGFLGFRSYTDISTLITGGENKLSQTLKAAEDKADEFERLGERIQTKYAKIQDQLDITAGLADKVSNLSTKVDIIEQKINISPELGTSIIGLLQSFQRYLASLGLQLNSSPISVEAATEVSGQGIADWDVKRNIIRIKKEYAGDVSLVLSTFASLVLQSQGNYKESVDLPYTAVVWGIKAYLTCSFRNDPYFSFRGINLGHNTRNLDQIRSNEDAFEVWGGLFWGVRDLLEQQEADKLIMSVWLTMEPPKDASVFPKLFATQFLKTYQSTTQGNHLEPLRALFRSRGMDI